MFRVMIGKGLAQARLTGTAFQIYVCIYTYMTSTVTHPFKNPCTCAALRRLTRQVSAVYDHHLASAGLKTSQYSLLMNLTEGGMPLSTLAQRTGTDRTTLTRNLAPLARAGWVAMGKGGDARQRLAQLTEAGARKRAAAYPLWEQAQSLIQTTLGDDAVRDLHTRIDTTVALLRPLIPHN